MKILALEASALVASVAIADDDNLIAEYTVNHKKTHSQTIMGMLDEIVKMTETQLADLDAIAVTGGPGSFTGLRIAAASVKGLAQALSKPVVSVKTLEALAYNMWGTDMLICPMMDARREQVYTGLYEFTDDNELVTVLDQTPLSIEEIAEKINAENRSVVLLGDGVGPNRDKLEMLVKVPFKIAPLTANRQRAASVAALGIKAYKAGNGMEPENFAPDYLRLSQAERERLSK